MLTIAIKEIAPLKEDAIYILAVIFAVIAVIEGDIPGSRYVDSAIEEIRRYGSEWKTVDFLQDQYAEHWRRDAFNLPDEEKDVHEATRAENRRLAGAIDDNDIGTLIPFGRVQ